MRQARQSPGIVRFGFGYDVHRLEPNRRLMLGGVRIPSRFGLLGHSDADVLLHAICDALLGSAALGDIGVHFPNTDRRYKNISSLKLLVHVGGLLKKDRFSVINIDSTIVLEAPKVGRFVPSMRRKIASALRIPPSAVSVKATTNEGLGHLGRGGGCAAFAVASVRAPDS
ncbi:MAG: 2-C-methyl-D-erythritol 2,4-cyclodiphosphate synthase [Ignavibacteriales bacterium]|nr:2-C-methyl-D-erythritol 2,4-cyclodiphosphate synthase [Ignavibacteriales bacterium]